MLHLAVMAALCAIPDSSDARLWLARGDVSFNVDLLFVGDPALGTGFSPSGDGSGDGRAPAPMPRSSAPVADDVFAGSSDDGLPDESLASTSRHELTHEDDVVSDARPTFAESEYDE